MICIDQHDFLILILIHTLVRIVRLGKLPDGEASCGLNKHLLWLLNAGRHREVEGFAESQKDGILGVLRPSLW